MNKTTIFSKPTLSNSAALTRFTLVALAMTLLFFVILEWTMVNEFWIATMIVPFFYSAGMFGTGFYFGRRSGEEREDVTDSGIGYHLSTFFVVSTVNLLFIILRHSDMIPETVVGTGFWGFFVLIHYTLDRIMHRYAGQRSKYEGA